MKYLSTVTLLLLPTTACFAGGLLNALPPDGTWAEYRVVVLDGFRYTVRIASVGGVTRDGVACRWIETKIEGRNGRDPIGRGLWKFLIPIKDLRSGGDPRQHFVEGWVKCLGFKARVVAIPDPPALEKFEAECGIPIVSIFMPPKLSDVNQRDAIQVYNEKLGLLSCRETVGKVRLHIEALRGDFQVRYLSRLNSDAPFGVVSSKIDLTDRVAADGTMQPIPEKIAVEIELTNFGDGAKSEFAIDETNGKGDRE